MKGKTATTGLLAMGIVIALATLGLVYGNWTQQLTIGGTVATSSLDASFKAFTTTDYEIDLGLKDIGQCDITPDADGKGAVVTIANAYPNYWCEISGGVVNTGNMPIHIEGGDVTIKNDPDGLINFLDIAGTCDGDKQLMPADSTGTPAGALQCTYRVTVLDGKAVTGGLSAVPQKKSIELNVGWVAVQFDKSTKP